MKLTTLTIAGLLIAGSLRAQEDGLDTLPEGFVIDQPKPEQMAQQLLDDIEAELGDRIQKTLTEKAGKPLTKYEEGLISWYIELEADRVKAAQAEQEKREAIAIAKAQEWDRVCAKSDAISAKCDAKLERIQLEERLAMEQRHTREEAQVGIDYQQAQVRRAAAEQQEILEGIQRELQTQTNMMQEEQLYPRMWNRH